MSRLDGLVIRPGQRLSFWYHVGRPTRRRGYVPGLVLSHGALTEGVGGGLCQLTNLVYWMTLHTPLTIAERWRHSYDAFADSGRTVAVEEDGPTEVEQKRHGESVAGTKRVGWTRA